MDHAFFHLTLPLKSIMPGGIDAEVNHEFHPVIKGIV